ncbi:MAG: hypothetical protein WA666_00220 [Nitrospirota bacterium]
MPWYFTVASEEYGTEEFGPYDTEEEAQAGIDRVAEEAIELNDDVERHFTRPYQRSERRVVKPMGIDRKALMGVVVAASGLYGLGIIDVLELLTDFLGFSETGVQDHVPEKTTVKELQAALVELLEKAMGRK